MTSDGQDSFIHFQTKLEDASDIELVVIVPTFRRPDHIVKTLKTIVSQRPDVPLATIVVENDADGFAGARSAKDFLSGHSFDSAVVVARRRGYAHACNAGLTAALDLFPSLGFAALIYDDEIAAPEWLDGLMAVQEAHDADIVGVRRFPSWVTPGAEVEAAPVFAPPYTERARTRPYLRRQRPDHATVLDGMPSRSWIRAQYRRHRRCGFLRPVQGERLLFAWASGCLGAESVPGASHEASWTRAASRERCDLDADGGTSAMRLSPGD